MGELSIGGVLVGKDDVGDDKEDLMFACFFVRFGKEEVFDFDIFSFRFVAWSIGGKIMYFSFACFLA